MSDEIKKPPTNAIGSNALLGYVVELEPGVWIAPWEGDPGRTLKLENAERFVGIREAETSLTKAKTFRQFPQHSIRPLYRKHND